MSRPASSYRGARRAEAKKRKLLWREMPHLLARGNGQAPEKTPAGGSVCVLVVLPP